MVIDFIIHNSIHSKGSKPLNIVAQKMVFQIIQILLTVFANLELTTKNVITDYVIVYVHLSHKTKCLK